MIWKSFLTIKKRLTRQKTSSIELVKFHFSEKNFQQCKVYGKRKNYIQDRTRDIFLDTES